MALELIECTHCGFKFKTDIERQLFQGETTAARGILDYWKQKKTRNVKTIDIMCTKCNKIFEYKLES